MPYQLSIQIPLFCRLFPLDIQDYRVLYSNRQKEMSYQYYQFINLLRIVLTFRKLSIACIPYSIIDITEKVVDDLSSHIGKPQ
jgi:hypothetical protein